MEYRDIGRYDQESGIWLLAVVALSGVSGAGLRSEIIDRACSSVTGCGALNQVRGPTGRLTELYGLSRGTRLWYTS